ncbi:hypothetical protein BpHYR1_010187, partial [Brachionus plicatilis]
MYLRLSSEIHFLFFFSNVKPPYFSENSAAYWFSTAKSLLINHFEYFLRFFSNFCAKIGVINRSNLRQSNVIKKRGILLFLDVLRNLRFLRTKNILNVDCLDCDDKGQRCNVRPGESFAPGFHDRWNLFKRSLDDNEQ